MTDGMDCPRENFLKFPWQSPANGRLILLYMFALRNKQYTLWFDTTEDYTYRPPYTRN